MVPNTLSGTGSGSTPKHSSPVSAQLPMLGPEVNTAVHCRGRRRLPGTGFLRRRILDSAQIARGITVLCTHAVIGMLLKIFPSRR